VERAGGGNRGIVAFLLIVFGGAWTVWGIAWLLPLPVAGAIAIFAAAAGIPRVAPDLPLTLLLAAVVGSLVSAPISWGEEFRWRGYLQLRLLGDRPLLAAIAAGLICWAPSARGSFSPGSCTSRRSRRSSISPWLGRQRGTPRALQDWLA
jgi:membrane protease YdiL (CAAX protease family)